VFKGYSFLTWLVCLVIAGCASADLNRPTAATYEGSAATMQMAIESYQRLEPRLTAQQKKDFKESYEGICRSYQTAGVLLESVTDAADPASANTALISYRRTVAALPGMIDKLAGLVRSFAK
jgi:hypothetical protein